MVACRQLSPDHDIIDNDNDDDDDEDGDDAHGDTLLCNHYGPHPTMCVIYILEV